MDFARLLVLYGVWIAAGVVLVGVAAMLLSGRGNRWFVPDSIFGWFGALIGFSIFGIGVFSLAVFVYVDVGGKGAALRSMEAAHGRAAPELQFTTLDGQPSSLAEYEGQVVLLNFWATWCSPCIEEMPALEAVHKNYAERGFVVLHLSDEPRDKISGWLEEHPMVTQHGAVDPAVVPAEPFDALNQARPISFLIDRDGVIRNSALGLMSGERIDRMVKPHL